MGAPPPLQRCAPKRTWTGRHERSQEARNPMRRDELDTRACCEHVLAACAIIHQGSSAGLQTTDCATDHFVALCDATRRAQPLIGAVLEGPSRICKLEQAGPWISCVWRLHCMCVLMYHQKQRRCFKMTGRTKPVGVTQQSMGGCLRSDHSQSRPYLYSSHRTGLGDRHGMGGRVFPRQKPVRVSAASASCIYKVQIRKKANGCGKVTVVAISRDGRPRSRSWTYREHAPCSSLALP
jgi:hypothetical protein